MTDAAPGTDRLLRTVVTLCWFSAMITVLLGLAMAVPLARTGRVGLAAAFSLLVVLGGAGAAAAFGLGRRLPWARPLAFGAFGAIGLVHVAWFALFLGFIEAFRIALNAGILTLLVYQGPPNPAAPRT